MTKIILPFLETMITQACNLSCVGCTNYSDLRHSGYVPWSQGQESILPWLDRINIPDFGIIGGEPLINPELEEWLLGLRKLLPKSQLRLTTNGLLLHKWPDLVRLLNSIGNCVFKITVHIQDRALEQHIENIFAADSWETVVEHGISRWRNCHGVRFQINRPSTFLKTYRNSYQDMAPYHSDPTDAFSKCIQQTCPLLYQGRIYKCSTSALLIDTLARFDNPNWDQWQRYIEYGICALDSAETIENFVNNFGKPHAQCAQCPGSTVAPLMHLFTVSRK